MASSDAERILKAVRLLAAAFPRAAWRDESEAAYTMALMDAGATPEEVNAAVRYAIQNEEQLPAVATLLQFGKTLRREELVKSWRCPKCGADNVAVDRGTIALCFECDWQAA